jgi:hypothetical protein
MRILTCFLSLITFSVFSQNLLLKKNGEQIAFKRFRFEAGSMSLRTADKDELRISPEQVIGYYDEDQQVLLYKIPLLETRWTFELWPRLKADDPYEFMERMVDGDIRLYKKEISSAPMTTFNGMTTPGASTTYLFAERDGVYKAVYVSGLFENRKDEKQALLSFIEDDGDLVAKLNSDEFSFNEKNVTRLVLDYNTRHFVRSVQNGSTASRQVGFYTQTRKKIKDSMVIKVNDSLEYKFGPKFPIQIPLPIGLPSKVCVTSLAGNGCMILTAVPFTMYFQIENNILKEDLEFKRESLQQFKNHMVHVMKNN